MTISAEGIVVEMRTPARRVDVRGIIGVVAVVIMLAVSGCSAKTLTDGSTNPSDIALAADYLKHHDVPPDLKPGWRRAVVYSGTYSSGSAKNPTWSAKVVVDGGIRQITVGKNTTQAQLLAATGNYIAYAPNLNNGATDIRVLDWGALPSLTPLGLPTHDEVGKAMNFMQTHPQPKLKGYQQLILVAFTDGPNWPDQGWVGLVMRQDGSLGTVFSLDKRGLVSKLSPGDYFYMTQVLPGRIRPSDIHMIQQSAVVPMGR